MNTSRNKRHISIKFKDYFVVRDGARDKLYQYVGIRITPRKKHQWRILDVIANKCHYVTKEWLEQQRGIATDVDNYWVIVSHKGTYQLYPLLSYSKMQSKDLVPMFFFRATDYSQAERIMLLYVEGKRLYGLQKDGYWY